MCNGKLYFGKTSFIYIPIIGVGLPGGSVVKNLAAMQEMWVPSWVGKIP